MKRLIITSSVLLASFIANAQDNAEHPFEPLLDRQFVFDAFNICAVVFVLYLVSSFILQLVKHRWDYRLKDKMVEKGTAANVVNQLVQSNKKNSENRVLQWVFVLCGIGIGFTLIYFSKPFGPHSLAIMGFSLAAVFFAYYLVVKNKKKSLNDDRPLND